MQSEEVNSIKVLRQENYQLKNQISELKNAFDLNRDILKILSQQSRLSQPDTKIFYQIIRRLTSLNNQTMIVFADMLHEKCLLKQENHKLQLEINGMKQQLQQLGLAFQKKSNPKQIHIQMRQEMQIWKKDMLLMKEQSVLKDQQIRRLKKLIQNRMNQFQPVIPFTNSTQDTFENDFQKNSKFNEKKVEIESSTSIQLQQLREKNSQLQLMIEEFQGRVVLLLKALKFKPKQQQDIRQQFKPQVDLQLSLLKFALNNMNVKSTDEDLKITMTRRCFERKQTKVRPKSQEKLQKK